MTFERSLPRAIPYNADRQCEHKYRCLFSVPAAEENASERTEVKYAGRRLQCAPQRNHDGRRTVLRAVLSEAIFAVWSSQFRGWAIAAKVRPSEVAAAVCGEAVDGWLG
jgi:hypothetical protein